MRIFVVGKALMISSTILLSGCAATLVTGIPISQAAVMRAPDGKITRWRGVVLGRPFGESPYEITEVSSGITCKGSSNNSGEASATCSDGRIITFKAPSRLVGSPTGSYVGTLADGTVFAAGWGLETDLGKLEKQLPKR